MRVLTAARNAALGLLHRAGMAERLSGAACIFPDVYRRHEFHARLLDGFGARDGRQLAAAAMGAVLGGRDAGGIDLYTARALAGMALWDVCGDGGNIRHWPGGALLNGLAAFGKAGVGLCRGRGLFAVFAGRGGAVSGAASDVRDADLGRSSATNWLKYFDYSIRFRWCKSKSREKNTN